MSEPVNEPGNETWDDYRARGIPGRLDALERGVNPTFVARLPSGFVVLGDTQFLRGYCVLLASPAVPSLEDLDTAGQAAFLADMTRLGRAIQDATGCARINYGIYGNTDPFLHAHVWARYEDEAPELRAHPAWMYPAEVRGAPEHAYDPVKHGALRRAIAVRLEGEA